MKHLIRFDWAMKKLLRDKANFSISNPKLNCFNFSPQSEFDALSLIFKNEKLISISYFSNNIPK